LNIFPEESRCAFRVLKRDSSQSTAQSLSILGESIFAGTHWERFELLFYGESIMVFGVSRTSQNAGRRILAHVASKVVEGLEQRRFLSSPTEPVSSGPTSHAFDDNSGGGIVRVVLKSARSTGDAMIRSTDLSSEGFGREWGVTRAWSNIHAGSGHGQGWRNIAVPQLTKDPASDRVTLFDFQTESLVFDMAGSSMQWSTIGTRQERMTLSGGEYRLSMPDGSLMKFHGFSSPATAKDGEFKELVQPGGRVIRATYDANHKLTSILRLPTTGSADADWSERYLYSYTTVGTLSRIESITLQRRDGNSNSVDIRRVDYTYYGSGSSFGRQGDLELVRVREGGGSGNASIIDESYYRYSVDGNLGPVGSLLHSFEASELAQLRAATPSWRTASNTTVSPFASVSATYYTTGRLFDITLRGEENPDGLRGTYRFAYEQNLDSAFSAANPTHWRDRVTLRGHGVQFSFRCDFCDECRT
jgi:hypothetical protein